MAAQKALNFAPGERFEYSNSGYPLLGIVVARASGKPLPEFAHDEIFGPLGMTHTSFGADHLLPLTNRAIGYNANDGAYRVNPSTLELPGDGGVRTTIGDMLLWLQSLDRNALGVHPDEVEALVRSPGKRNDGREVSYAFGLGVGSRHGETMFDHTGEYAGYESFVAWLPRHRLGVVTLCNAEQASFSAWSLGLKAIDLYVAPSARFDCSVFRYVSRRRIELDVSRVGQRWQNFHHTRSRGRANPRAGAAGRLHDRSAQPGIRSQRARNDRWHRALRVRRRCTDDSEIQRAIASIVRKSLDDRRFNRTAVPRSSQC